MRAISWGIGMEGVVRCGGKADILMTANWVLEEKSPGIATNCEAVARRI